jgi:hypothetical protein
LASQAQASAGDFAQAAGSAGVIVLATPWPNAQEVIDSLGDISGKLLIDCTNPLNSDMTGLELGHTISAAEQIADWAPGAYVVKAFNNVSAATMVDPVFADQTATMFYCGDHREPKRTVHELACALGLDAVDAGPLRVARLLEPMAMLYIQLAVHEGWGSDCAFKIMKR